MRATVRISNLTNFLYLFLLLCNVPSLHTSAKEEGQSFCSLTNNEGQDCTGENSWRWNSESNELFESYQLKTGLEFLPDSFQPGLDEDFYIGQDAFSSERFVELSLMKLVGMFVRELKGLPRDRLHNSFIGSGENEFGDKPAWCFYPYRLKKLAEIELEIYKILKKFHSVERTPFPALESYLVDIEESSLSAFSRISDSNKLSDWPSEESDPYLYIGSHPLLIYRMIRRFSEDLQPILSKLETEKDLISSIFDDGNPDLEIFPTNEDLEDALESLVRIQKGTNIKAEEFGNGILEELDTGIQLNALHALEVGAFHIDAENYDLAIQWLYLASEKVSISPKAHEFPVIEMFFLKMLEYAVNQHNKEWKRRRTQLWNPGVFISKIVNSSDLSSYQKMWDINKEKAAALEERKNDVWNWAIPLNFAQVCSGVNLQTPEEKLNLKCWYFRKEHPYWFINPLKVELLNSEPPILQMYEFLGEKYMKEMRTAAIGNLERSTVVDGKSAYKSKVDKVRTSVQVWLYDDKHSGRFLQSLTKKLEILTDLIVSPESASDAYQVAAYGSSHHYEPHIDAFEDGTRGEARGNRIVTIMGYLSDVAVGGRTGFPVLGIFAEPVKGSILVWENLKSDVETREGLTFHGGCPVVLGVKWITNKWIYAKDNMFKYPCTDTSREAANFT